MRRKSRRLARRLDEGRPERGRGREVDHVAVSVGDADVRPECGVDTCRDLGPNRKLGASTALSKEFHAPATSPPGDTGTNGETSVACPMGLEVQEHDRGRGLPSSSTRRLGPRARPPWQPEPSSP